MDSLTHYSTKYSKKEKKKRIKFCLNSQIVCELFNTAELNGRKELLNFFPDRLLLDYFFDLEVTL